jgi:hypothetical protein
MDCPIIVFALFAPLRGLRENPVDTSPNNQNFSMKNF